MALPSNCFYKILIGSSEHEIIPRGVTDSYSYATVPTLSSDKYLVVSETKNTPETPSIPNINENFTIIARKVDVVSSNITFIKFLCIKM